MLLPCYRENTDKDFYKELVIKFTFSFSLTLCNLGNAFYAFFVSKKVLLKD